MKSVLKLNLVLLVLLASSYSLAKITDFKNHHAVNIILNNQQLLSYLTRKNISPDSLRVDVRSKGHGIKKKFLVRLTHTKKSNLGIKTCYLDFFLKNSLVPATVEESNLNVKNDLYIYSSKDEVCHDNSTIENSTRASSINF